MVSTAGAHPAKVTGFANGAAAAVAVAGVIGAIF
jgi:hypothetical protein